MPFGLPDVNAALARLYADPEPHPDSVKPWHPRACLLDLAPGSGSTVALVGWPGGKVGCCWLFAGGTGQFVKNEFDSPVTDLGRRFPKSILYRYAYHGARSVPYEYDYGNGVWTVGKAEDINPQEIGRATPYLHEDAYETQLASMAKAVLEEIEGKPEGDRIGTLTKLLGMVARHSFARGWKEQGFGFW